VLIRWFKAFLSHWRYGANPAVVFSLLYLRFELAFAAGLGERFLVTYTAIANTTLVSTIAKPPQIDRIMVSCSLRISARG
jgi:hypothetical protein